MGRAASELWWELCYQSSREKERVRVTEEILLSV